MPNRMGPGGSCFFADEPVVRPPQIEVPHHLDALGPGWREPNRAAPPLISFSADMEKKRCPVPSAIEKARRAGIKTAGRILVVNDDLDLLSIVSKMLETLRYKVDAVSNGLAGIERLSTNRYDLAVLDLEMREIEAHRLFVWLKSKSPHTRSMVITGCCQSEVAGLMLSGIVDAWLFKPLRLNELHNAVNTLGI